MASFTPSGAWIPSSPVIDGLGFPLGTRVQTFFLDAKHPNALVPGKRPRTTLTPTLVMRDGQPCMVFGTPGGDQQDQWTLQFFLAVADFEMEVQDAIEAPRFSTSHFPTSFYPHNRVSGLLRVEIGFPKRHGMSSKPADTGSRSTRRGARGTCWASALMPGPARCTAERISAGNRANGCRHISLAGRVSSLLEKLKFNFRP